MFVERKKPKIQFPDRDPVVVKLKAELDALHDQMSRDSTVIARGRARLDDLQALESTGGPSTRAQRGEVAREVDDAGAALKTARDRIRIIAAELPQARQAAARRISAEHAPAFRAAAKTYLLHRVERLAPEIVAAVHLRSVIAPFGALRLPLPGPVPHSMNRQTPELEQLREDAAALLAAGVIKRGDLPRAVVEAWGF